MSVEELQIKAIGMEEGGDEDDDADDDEDGE